MLSCCFGLMMAACLGPPRSEGDAHLARSEPPRRIPAAEDAAVHRALEFLKNAQQPDGAWVSGGFGPATSVTSLAVMAFLAAGHVPGDPGPYRNALERGIRYVLAHQESNGLLVSRTSHGPMYCHGISTLMLAEVAGMTQEEELAARTRAALARAVKLILAAQAVPKNEDHTGGWRYQPNSNDSDISVTGWQLMALRAAKAAGCEVPSSSIDRAVAYLKRCALKQGGGFGYVPRGGSQQSPHRHGDSCARDLRRTSDAASRRRGRVFAQESAQVVHAVLLLRGLLLSDRDVSDGRQIFPALQRQAGVNPAGTSAK